MKPTKKKSASKRPLPISTCTENKFSNNLRRLQRISLVTIHPLLFALIVGVGCSPSGPRFTTSLTSPAQVNSTGAVQALPRTDLIERPPVRISEQLVHDLFFALRIRSESAIDALISPTTTFLHHHKRSKLSAQTALKGLIAGDSLASSTPHSPGLVSSAPANGVYSVKILETLSHDKDVFQDVVKVSVQGGRTLRGIWRIYISHQEAQSRIIHIVLVGG